MSHRSLPLARRDDLLTEALDDDLLVYDESRDIACRLNLTAALIWRECDGEHSIAELQAALRDEIGELVDEDLVLVTLDRLEENGLLESGYDRRPPAMSRESRRRFIRRVGVVGSAALALPVVQSIIAPTPAAAASVGGTCGTCGTCGT